MLNWELNFKNNSNKIVIDEKNLNGIISFVRVNAHSTIMWLPAQPRILFKKATQNEIFSELFVSILSKKIGHNNVEVKPATFVFDEKTFSDYKLINKNNANCQKVVNGIITPDYIENRLQTETYIISDFEILNENNEIKQNTFEQHIKTINEFKLLKEKQGFQVNIDPKLETSLIKNMIVDFVCDHRDKVAINQEYVVKTTGNKISVSVSPSFDNASAFMSQLPENSIILEINNPEFKSKAISALKEKLYQSKPNFHFENPSIEEFTTKNHHINMLAKNICEKQELNDFFNKLKNVKFENIVSEIINDNAELEINNSQKSIAKFVYENNISIIHEKVLNHKSLNREL